ncbi:hypothetical protein ACIGGF_14025 [Rhodococcus sp. NPDC078407]|uniref:hypothetical protein n=1 Tax=Rhodococcus sp. NPDC078407 TaxID=3364509 RepID=UPI0037C964E0
MTAAHAVKISFGGISLYVGDEVGVIAAEVVAVGVAVRIESDALNGMTAALASAGVTTGGLDALVVFTENHHAETHESDRPCRVEVENLGEKGGPLSSAIDSWSLFTAAGVLAEAASVAWLQLLSDTEALGRPFSRGEAARLKPVLMSGNPSLFDLLVERRRTLKAILEGSMKSPTTEPADSAQDSALNSYMTDLRRSVEFGAVGLTEVPDNDFDSELKAELSSGDWIRDVRALLALEEVQAIGMVLKSEAFVSGEPVERSVEKISAFFEALSTQLAEHEKHAKLIEGVLDRIPHIPDRRRIQRISRRRAQGTSLEVAAALGPYVLALRGAEVAQSIDRQNWQQVSKSLASVGDSDFAGRKTIDEVAEELGEMFEAYLPVAKQFVEDLRSTNPNHSAEDLVTRAKKSSTLHLKMVLAEGDEESAVETIATFAMVIAVLREIELSSNVDFKILGRKIAERLDRTVRVSAKAGEFAPAISSALQTLIYQIRPFIVEAAFSAMSNVKPSKQGPARQFYKQARSKTWRARYNKGLDSAAANGATRLFLQAFGSGAARTLVRSIDRSLKVRRN